MKKFIKLLLLFSLPVLVGMISLEFLLRNIPNDYSYKKGYLDSKSNNIEVFFQAVPIFISRNSFNAAHISQSLNLDLAILEKYNDRWRNLKYIIIPIDYFSMYSSIEEGIAKWRIKNYNIYYGISQNWQYLNYFEIFYGKLTNHISRVNEYLIDNKTDITCNEFGFGILLITQKIVMIYSKLAKRLQKDIL